MANTILFKPSARREPPRLVPTEHQKQVIAQAKEEKKAVYNLTWEQIGDELHADRTTVYRWHNSAVNHVKLPENPIQI